MKGKIIVIAVLLLLVVPMFTTALAQACTVKENGHDNCALHQVPAYQTSNTQITYAQLTDYCLNVWGLSANPYPAYSPTDKTSYMVFTFMIGDHEYQGVSCNTYTSTYSLTDKTVTLTYNATWYVGDWGKANARMNQGFEGTVVVILHNYNFVTKAYDYHSAQFNLQGFHRFNHQSLVLTVEDSRITKLATGYCEVLGHKDDR